MGFITINHETINLESIDYITQKEAQKSKDDKTPVFVLSLVLKSGVQVAIPFSSLSKRSKAKKAVLKHIDVSEKVTTEMKKS